MWKNLTPSSETFPPHQARKLAGILRKQNYIHMCVRVFTCWCGYFDLLGFATSFGAVAGSSSKIGSGTHIAYEEQCKLKRVFLVTVTCKLLSVRFFFPWWLSDWPLNFQVFHRPFSWMKKPWELHVNYVDLSFYTTKSCNRSGHDDRRELVCKKVQLEKWHTMQSCYLSVIVFYSFYFYYSQPEA